MADVRFVGTRQDIVRIARQVGAMLAGRETDQHGVGRGFLLALGYAALSGIKDAFVQKADGGTDEMGITWPPLSREYLAYGRRFVRGEQSRLKRSAGLGRGNWRAPGGNKGLLSAAELTQWRKIYSQRLARYMLSEGESAAKSHAAAVAWIIMKKKGAKTKLEVYGNRKVQILRDTGRLLNSLSPGLLSGAGSAVSYSKPGGEGGSEQIMEVQPGVVIVGTNVKYASGHQRGKRPFLPDESHPVPVVWWDRWTAFALAALVVSVELMYRAESGR